MSTPSQTYRMILNVNDTPEGWVAEVQIAARGSALAEARFQAPKQIEAILAAVKEAVSRIARVAA